MSRQVEEKNRYAELHNSNYGYTKNRKYEEKYKEKNNERRYQPINRRNNERYDYEERDRDKERGYHNGEILDLKQWCYENTNHRKLGNFGYYYHDQTKFVIMEYSSFANLTKPFKDMLEEEKRLEEEKKKNEEIEKNKRMLVSFERILEENTKQQNSAFERLIGIVGDNLKERNNQTAKEFLKLNTTMSNLAIKLNQSNNNNNQTRNRIISDKAEVNSKKITSVDERRKKDKPISFTDSDECLYSPMEEDNIEEDIVNLKDSRASRRNWNKDNLMTRKNSENGIIMTPIDLTNNKNTDKVENNSWNSSDGLENSITTDSRMESNKTEHRIEDDNEMEFNDEEVQQAIKGFKKKKKRSRKEIALTNNYISVLTHRTMGLRKYEDWNPELIAASIEYGCKEETWDKNDTKSIAIKKLATAIAELELLQDI